MYIHQTDGRTDRRVFFGNESIKIVGDVYTWESSTAIYK